MLHLVHVSKHYRLGGSVIVKAVDDVDLQLQRGEFVVIVGRSGSGKTTLLSLMAALTKPTSGRVLFDDLDLWRLTDAEQSVVRAEKIGFVFQVPSLIPTMTVLDNLRVPTMFAPRRGSVGEQALQLLTLVGIPDKAAAYPAQLSVGQQKRVALARALMNQPELLLADEPTSDLDEATESEIMALLGRVHAETRNTIVMVTHNTDLARHGTRVFRMSRGQLAAVKDIGMELVSELPLSKPPAGASGS
jgi:ABC-type lipoprotein export system ATPase subunit